MNWLDIVLIVILALGLIWGLRTGLLGAIFTTIGVLVGWLLAGQLADDIGGIFESSLTADTLVTVVSYAIIIIAAVVIAGFVGKIIRPILVVGTLGTAGLADRLGGLALGLIVGLAVASVFITGVSRFAYNFTVPTPSIDAPGVAGKAAGAVTGGLGKTAQPIIDDRKEAVVNALTGSTIVPIFMKVRGALPGSTLGFIPADFAAALDILQTELDSS